MALPISYLKQTNKLLNKSCKHHYRWEKQREEYWPRSISCNPGGELKRRVVLHNLLQRKPPVWEQKAQTQDYLVHGDTCPSVKELKKSRLLSQFIGLHKTFQSKAQSKSGLSGNMMLPHLPLWELYQVICFLEGSLRSDPASTSFPVLHCLHCWQRERQFLLNLQYCGVLITSRETSCVSAAPSLFRWCFVKFVIQDRLTVCCTGAGPATSRLAWQFVGRWQNAFYKRTNIDSC